MIRLLIVVGIQIYGEGLSAVLDGKDRIHVVGTANTEEQALSRLQDCRPDVVLLDMTIPQSVVILRAMYDQVPELNIVALGVSEVESEVIACAEAGACGYLAHNASVDDLVTVVRYAFRGELYCSPRIARSLLRRIAGQVSRRTTARSLTRLTAREMEIADLLDLGLSNKQIARRLHIGVSTVKNHVHNILEKLQVNRRGEAAALLRSQRQQTGAAKGANGQDHSALRFHASDGMT